MKISEKVSEAALLGQLAEECCELAQAALKIQRIIDGSNPTPVTIGQALKNMAEEATDISLCLDQLKEKGYVVFDPAIYCEKKNRWESRLKKEGK